MFKVIKLEKNGDASDEYVLLEAIEDANIGNHLILDNTFRNGTKSNTHRHVYIFPEKKIKKGELVSLRTGKGQDREFLNNKGTKVHRFYWGSDAPIWNDAEDDSAFLLRYSVVDSSAS